MSGGVYHVHRGGAVWRVVAPSLMRAASCADADWSKRLGSDCRIERECEAPPVTAADTVLALVPATAWIGPSRVRAIVHHVGDDADPRRYRGYAVHDLESPLALRYVVDVVLEAAQRLDAARKVPRVRLPVGVDVYKTGKRQGQLRFPKGTSAEQRELAQRLRDDESAREAAVEEAQAHLESTLEVLTSRDVALLDPATVAECDAISGWFDALASALPVGSGEVRVWLVDGRRTLARLRDALHSQDVFGYRVGEHCYVERDPNDTVNVQAFGRCEIVGAGVEHWRSGGEDHETHYRSVIDAAGREWDVPLRWLSKEPP